MAIHLPDTNGFETKLDALAAQLQPFASESHVTRRAANVNTYGESDDGVAEAAWARAVARDIPPTPTIQALDSCVVTRVSVGLTMPAAPRRQASGDSDAEGSRSSSRQPSARSVDPAAQTNDHVRGAHFVETVEISSVAHVLAAGQLPHHVPLRTVIDKGFQLGRVVSAAQGRWIMDSSLEDMVLAAFWWALLRRWPRGRDHSSSLDKLYSAWAQGYQHLWRVIHHDVTSAPKHLQRGLIADQRAFLTTLPTAFVRAVYCAFATCFPGSAGEFNEAFKRDLTCQLTQKLTGIYPSPTAWRNCHLDDLEPPALLALRRERPPTSDPVANLVPASRDSKPTDCLALRACSPLLQHGSQLATAAPVGGRDLLAPYKTPSLYRHTLHPTPR